MSESTENEQKKKDAAIRRDSVKLDQIIKLLFNVSKPTLINVINGLFNENYDPDNADVDVIKTATEYVKKNLDIIRADIFLQVTSQDKTKDYHLEFQLAAGGKNIIVRLLEYDIQYALDNLRLEDDIASAVVRLPKCIVLHFEPSGTIPSKYRMKVEFPNGTSGEYEADVMKYYDYADKALVDKKLYNLLPLQLFLLRAELEKTHKGKDEQARQAAIANAKEMIDKIFDAVTELHQEQKIDANDYDKIGTGLAEIMKHLDTRYNLNNELIGGIKVIKTLMNKNALRQMEKQTKIEMATKMLLKNKPMDEIIDFTGLREKEIKSIQKNLNKEN